jgi:ADP-ribose pyrophosphatase
MTEISISKREIYHGRVVHLDVHEVRLENGGVSIRELVTHPGAVAIVPMDDEGNVLMVRQFRFAAGRVLLEIPAGTLEVGEDPDVCAIRELREETGMRPAHIEKIGGIFVAPGYTTEYIHLYYATGMSDDPLPQDADEAISVERVALADALQLIETGEIADGKSITALLRVARRLGV